MSNLKHRKEQFVTGLEGGSLEEINLITSVALCGYVCWNLLHATAVDGKVILLADFFFNWCAILLAITTYSDSPLALNLLLIVPPLALWLITGKTKTTKKSSKRSPRNPGFALQKHPYITAYRGSMMVITALAILAVDFPIFPRRFAKVETWGTSLMDLGVGSFVFSNGLVSSRALLKEKLGSRKATLTMKCIYALKSGGTILVLGLLRLFFVKNLEYQEHVTEYGVHWNFFITLALLPFFMIIFDAISEYIPRVLLALIMSGTYELFMIFKEGFLSFLITGTRDNFLSSNREGIFSFIGYCSIFLWGQNTGFYTLGNTPTKNNLLQPSVLSINQFKSLSLWDRMTSKGALSGLFTWSFVSLVANQAIVKLLPYDVSRRFANLPYVMWVVSFNIAALACFCLVDKIFNNDAANYQTSSMLEAMNSNGLFLFLLANVTTGLVNMLIPTIDVAPTQAFIVLLMYASFLALVSVVMLQNRIFIKL